MANISMDTLMIEIQSTTKNATSSIESLIRKLGTLSQALENVSKESDNFSKLKTSLSGVSNSVKVAGSGKQTQKQTTDTTPTPNVGNLSALLSQTAVLDKQGSLLANFRSQLKAVGLSQSDLGKKISQTTNQTTKVITEITRYDTELGKLTVTARTTGDGLTRYATSLREVGSESKKNINIFKAMTSGISGAILQAQIVWNTIKGTATTLGNLAMNGASYYESLNLFATTLGDRAQEAMDWVDKFSNALYLDPNQVMQYMGSFDSLIKGLGVGTDNAYLMSQNLTQLTYDLASFKNLDFQTAFEKLQSGISGEIEPLRNVGVALSEATLQELAYSMGIDESVSSMNEAEKAQLRYIQIMKSSTDWQADMGKTLLSPANAIRVIQQQFKLLGRAIGNVFIPIIMFAIPYVMVFTEILTDLANALANVLEKVFGIDLDFSLDTSGFDTSVGDITGGLEDVGDEADKTKNKLNTMLAPFDELNNVQTHTQTDGSGNGNGGASGGDLGLDLPQYDALSKLTDEFSNKIDEAKENLKELVPIILTIGGGFAAWKISKTLLERFQKLKDIGASFSFSLSFAGLSMFLADLDDLKDAIDDIIENGANFTNVTSLLSEFAGGIGDVFTILGKTKPGGALKTIQGIGEIVSAVSDISKKGVNWDNATKAIKGLTNVAIGIGLFLNTAKGLKLAGVSLTIQGITKVVEELHDNWDAITKGDWGNVDKIGLLTGVLEVLGGVILSIKAFNDIKKGVDLKNTVANVTEVSNMVSGIDKPTSSLTKTLANLAKNLGLGIAIIAEVSAAAILFVGAIWVLGAELEQVGKAWEPVINSGNKVLTALGLGTALLVSVGTAAGLLGYATTSTGGTIALAIGIGTAMLLEIGAASLLFVAEVWAVGAALQKVGEAWQPVLDNGDTIASGIELATALLIAIGVATAALGTATVASVGLLPVAIGLGTALLVELADSTKKFVDSITKVAKQLNNNLAPQLESVNENASTINKGLKNYTNFMKKLATSIFETTKVDVFAGFSGAVNKLIGFFAGNPIKKFANDVDKTYEQTKDLNKKLRNANPELKDAIDLTSNYFKLINRLDKITKNNKTSNLAGNLYTNMQTAGKRLVTGLVNGMQSQISKYNSAINKLYNSINTNKANDVGYNFGKSMANGINRGIKNNLLTTIQLTSNGKKASTTYKIKAYAEGGYPDDADLFFANENGIPEMIGRIGNQTAVANNDQITDAVASAVLQAINNSNLGSSNNAPTTIYIGNKKVYEGFGNHVQRENDRYGTNMIRI